MSVAAATASIGPPRVAFRRRASGGDRGGAGDTAGTAGWAARGTDTVASASTSTSTNSSYSFLPSRSSTTWWAPARMSSNRRGAVPWARSSILIVAPSLPSMTSEPYAGRSLNDTRSGRARLARHDQVLDDRAAGSRPRLMIGVSPIGASMVHGVVQTSPSSLTLK